MYGEVNDDFFKKNAKQKNKPKKKKKRGRNKCQSHEIKINQS